MESDSSAKSLLSLFSSSKLATFTNVPQRSFYQSSPDNTGDASSNPVNQADTEPPPKRRCRSKNAEEWTKGELRALETFRNLYKGGEIDSGLRDVLLPSRTAEEIKFQLSKLGDNPRQRRKSKLEALEKEEAAAFDEEERQRAEEKNKQVQRAKTGLDNILRLSNVAVDADGDSAQDTEPAKVEDVKASLDQILGLAGESEQERRKRELDELLGLTGL